MARRPDHSAPTPFAIPVDPAQIADLHQRLHATRWPDQLVDTTWEHGTSLTELRALVQTWADEFDWPAEAARLDAELPSWTLTIPDEHGPIDVHYAHLRPEATGDLPVIVLLHGWPSSFAEMREVATRLHGAGFEVVVPSLPGHGYSSIPRTIGYGADACARSFAVFVHRVIGERPYVVHGGDRGAFVATGMGVDAPSGLAGIHLTLPGGIPGDGDHRTDEENQWLADTAQWVGTEGGYSAIQSTRPQTISYGLHDSPAGLLGWIIEKFRAWSDCRGDLHSVFSDTDLLVNATIYWMTETLRSSAHWYWEHRVEPPRAMQPTRVDVPTAVIRYPFEVMRVPRSAVQRKYNLVRWTDKDAGGHFPAHEDPVGLSTDIAEFATSVSRPGVASEAK